ncbi:hypothetical protein PIB30_034142 [Stylosanthes scabra]|uniref:Uncharacterized protein n=1 Tax=Stylosanthes scabra TaxID=79078 RepID=A0ABU6UCK0_9FABA|nr:hypothetical protein [Stylosanthes scabra]
MERHTQAQLAMSIATHAQLESMGEMGADLRSCVKIVDACLDAFVQKKAPTTEAVEENVDIPIGSTNPTKATTEPSDKILVVDLSGGPASDSTVVAPRKFPPGLISEWLDDTILMGPGVQNNDVSDPSAHPSSAEAVSIPSAVRRKLQARLGDVPGGVGSVSAPRTRVGIKGKLTEQSPEEAKRSGKMRRAGRETTVRMYGYKKIGVVFPSYIWCKFKICEKYKYCQQQAEVVAYIFADRKNQVEVLFKRDTRKLDREDLATLLPGNEPSDYIMELMAYKTSWTQRQIRQTTFWSLPVLFSDFVLDGDLSMEDLFSMFKDEWLATPNALRYDAALNHIIRVGFHEVAVLGNRRPLHKWKTEYVLGVPNMGNPTSCEFFSGCKWSITFVRALSEPQRYFLAFNELKKEVAELAREDWDPAASVTRTPSGTYFCSMYSPR